MKAPKSKPLMISAIWLMTEFGSISQTKCKGKKEEAEEETIKSIINDCGRRRYCNFTVLIA